MGIWPILIQELFNVGSNWWGNRRAERLSREGAEMMGEPADYTTSEFGEVYQPFNYGGLNEDVERYIQSGAVDGRALAGHVGQFFSDADTDAFERSSLADIAAGSDARSRSRIQQTVGSGMARGRGLDEMGDALGAMQYQEDVARGGQALGVQATAEQIRNQTNLARAGAQSQALLTGTSLQNELTKLGAGMRGQIGLAEGDQTLRAALAQLASEQSNADRSMSLNVAKGQTIAGIPTSPYYTRGGSDYLAYLASKPKGGGFGLMGGIGGYEAGFSSGGCIDGNVCVVTPLGVKPLGVVCPSDRILGADGEFHAVVAKDYGHVELEQRIPHLRIVAGDASITMTGDHILEGKRADEWQVGDPITVNGEARTVTRIEPAEYVASGDLCLESNADYVAGGFVVSSQIGKNLNAYRQLIRTINLRALGKLQTRDGWLVSVANIHGSWVRLVPETPEPASEETNESRHTA